MKLRIVLAFIGLIISDQLLYAQTEYDVEVIKSKLYTLCMERSSLVETAVDKPIKELEKTLDASGKWPDINYQDRSASVWKPAMHWKRLLELSIQYRDKTSPYCNKPALRQSILRAIQSWIKAPPIATNYWWNAIGVPNLMGAVYILMEKELSDSVKLKGAELMKVGVKPTYYNYHGKATGQNLLWLASAHLYASCITKDAEGVKRAFASVGDEIKISEEEGIQPDFSFYQHGKQNYAMGYGKGFTKSAAQYFYLANKTVFQYPQNKIDVIARYLLDGQQWMTRYSYLEYTAMGREVSRQGNDGKPLLKALQWMMDIDARRRTEYTAFYKRLSGIKEETPLVGNRYFWRSDLMVHQRKNYYFSLKAASNRISSSETGNGENLKGFYQGNGTYYLIRNGDEYKDIFPVWDWRKLPGLLTKQISDTFPLITWGVGAEGATSFVYGISDSLYGCFAYDYNKDGVTARRSWFFFDNEIVYLANGINGDHIYQSINQSLLNGNVWTNDGMQKGTGEQKVFHDSVGYCINNNGNSLELKTGKQTGSWKKINLSGSAAPVSKKVFSLGIHLGSHAKNTSLSYTILAGTSLEKFKQYNLKDHISILENNNNTQAVYQKDIEQVQGVCFSANTIELPWNNLSIKMKQPGLFLIRKIRNKLVIDYSQPFPKKNIELVIVNKTLFSNEEIEVTRNL